MEDILTSIQKQSENLDIKHEDSWETEAGFHDVTVGANLKGNITHFNENTHNDIDQDTQEPSETNVFLINLEIGSKTIENVSISRDCQLQDVAEELAQDEMVKVVYFLHEKITKGGNNFDASEAQVLVKLRSNWNWICIDELVDDSTMTIEEVFSNMPDYFKPLFSLAPKVNRKTEPQAGQPVITDTCSQSSLASFTGHTTGRSIKNSDENPGIRLITELKDLLAKHNISELLKKDSQLGKDILRNVTTEASHFQISHDKIMDLKKCLRGLHTLLTSLPMSSTLSQHLQKDHYIYNDNANADDGSSFMESYRHESYMDNSAQEDSNEKCTAPLSRQRTLFNPVIEVPRLKEWFDVNPSPNKHTINHYVNELNSSAFRRGKSPVTDKAVYIWFKNTRARKDKNKLLKSQSSNP